MSVQSPRRRTLEDFALKGLHLGKMTGVSLAIHAIPDAFLLMHTGVGCKYKTAAQVAPHDWGTHPNKREAWTQVAELQLIRGSSERIGPFARSWYERRRPEFMVVVSAYFIELTGEDFTDEVVEVESQMPCPMALIPTVAPNDGFFDGYASVILEVVKKMDFSRPPSNLKKACVVGTFFNRYEGDQRGDLAQLRRLVKTAGLELGVSLFSGQPYPDLQRGSDAAWMLMLPYARPKRRALKELMKRRHVVELDLPVGVQGTGNFVRRLAQAHGADMRLVQRVVDRQMGPALAELRKVSAHLRGVKLAVFAETPLAAGLVALFDEMGVEVPVVGLRDANGCLGGRLEFLEILARNGFEGADKVEVLEEPSLRWIRETMVDMLTSRRITGVVGSTHEVTAITNSPRASALPSSAFFIETGFPSDHHHVTLGAPTFGFTGAVGWAQRVLDAVRRVRPRDAALGGVSEWAPGGGV